MVVGLIVVVGGAYALVYGIQTYLVLRYKVLQEKGAVPELSNTMIYLLVSSESLTAVVDDPDTEEMKKLLASIRHVLQSESLCAEPLKSPKE